MSHRITPPSTPVVATNNRVQTISSSRPHALPRPENAVDVYNARGPLNLDPPKADKIPTSIANYQSRWEREKSKARAEGVDIDAKDPKMIGPWVVGEMLGRGASGRVRLARHATTGKMAAIKILNIHPNLSSRSSALASAGAKAEKMMLTAEREIAVMKLLDHPNIMKMYDVWSSPNELYLVLEYVQGGELFDYLCSRGSRLPILEALSIIKQVFAAVHYCHRFNICHRDLKPENILLVDETVAIPGSAGTTTVKHVKVADFGMSTLDSLNGLLRTSCGSPHYASPEIVRGQMYSGAASDIWSCGVILFALVTSRLPFDDPNVNNVLRKVKDGRFTVPDGVIPEAKDLLMRILEVDINKRITMREIFSHPLMRIDTPGIVLPPAPRLDEFALPVTREEIDPDLLRNLCIIWREKNRTAMVDRLCSNEKNFEKAFYFLLCRYRDHSFEEYNADSETLQVTIASGSHPSSQATYLPTPLSNEFHNRIASPIKRHYPGRATPKVASLKKAAQGPPTRYGDGSPVKYKTREPERKAGVNSPRKNRVLSHSSIASSSPQKMSSLHSRRPGAPRSRTGTLGSLKDEGDCNRSRRASTTGAIGTTPLGKTAISPPRRASVASGDRTSPKQAPGLSPAKQSPRKVSQTSVSKVVSPRKSTPGSPARVISTPVVHRRASSGSATIPVHGLTGAPRPNSSRLSSASAVATRTNKPQDESPEGQVASKTSLYTRSPVIIPNGIVQQRASLLTSKLLQMGVEPLPNNQVAHSSAHVDLLSKTPPPLVVPSATVNSPLQTRPRVPPHISRLPSGGLVTPTRPLARTIMAPTVFSSDSVGSGRRSADTPLRTAVNGRQRQGKVEEPSSVTRPTKAGQSFTHLRTPGKAGRGISVLETPSKSPVKGFLGSPNRIRGLGFFVSPGKSNTRSPSKSNTQRVVDESAFDEDPTPKASILNATSHAGSKRPLTKFGILEEEREDDLKFGAQKKQLDMNALLGRPNGESVNVEEHHIALNTSGSSDHRNSGSSANMSVGRSSADTGNSSSDAWEKVEWSEPTSGEPLPVKNAPRPKKRPAPLDLFNPYHKDRRSRVPLLNGLTAPLEPHRQSQSPHATPFLGFAGFSWASGSSAPPTPALVASSGMQSDPSSGSSQAVLPSSGASRGIFSKIFDWKAPYLSFISAGNPVATREECARVLRCLNINFVPSETGGFTCCADEVFDRNGSYPMKSITFRVDIQTVASSRPATPSLVRSQSFTGNQRSSTSNPRSQWSTSLDIGASSNGKSLKQEPQSPTHGESSVTCIVTLVSEKGSHSTFRVVHQRMQESWRFVTLGPRMHGAKVQ